MIYTCVFNFMWKLVKMINLFQQDKTSRLEFNKHLNFYRISISRVLF